MPMAIAAQEIVIINNAGIIQHFIPIKDLSYEEINRVFNVNFFGTVYMIKAFLPYFIDRPEAHIVNISSMGGFLPVPGQSICGSAVASGYPPSSALTLMTSREEARSPPCHTLRPDLLQHLEH